MLGKLLPPSPVSAFNCRNPYCFPYADHVAGTTNTSISVKLKTSLHHSWNNSPNRWLLSCSTSHTAPTPSSATNQDTTAESWSNCKQLLSTIGFTSTDDQEKILGKAFGQIHSPYWSEDRKVEVPNFETVNTILEYLRSLSLSDEDINKVVKKFPEVLGCSLEGEVKGNVEILEKQWKIKGKSLRNVLLRNPKVLGFNIDCKGDCMALCTRCWARF